MTQIIGINGFKRSGKGACAAAVADILSNNYKVHEVGFADKVKLWAAMSLGLTGTDEQLIAMMNKAKEHWEFEVWDVGAVGSLVMGLTGREYLQHIGNQARHLFGEDFWVDQVLPKIVGTYDRARPECYVEDMYPGVDVLVMADLRYENEAQRVIDLGGTIWEVLRPGVESDGHASERPLPRSMVSWQIMNDGGLDVLRYRTEDAIAETTPC